MSGQRSGVAAGLVVVERNFLTVGSRLAEDGALRAAAAHFFRGTAEAGILACPIKGVVLGAEVYSDALARPFGDVDVLVSPRDLRPLRRWAERRGYPIIFDSTHAGVFNIIVPPGIPIDVRSSLGPPGFALGAAAKMVHASVARVDERVFSGSFQRLADEDHLLVLMVDAVYDKFIDKSFVGQRREDLARATSVWGRDVGRFAARARQLRLRRVALAALIWSAGADHSRGRGSDLSEALSPTFLERAWIATILREMQLRPRSAQSRVGSRLLADRVSAALLALASGAAGIVAHRVRRSLVPEKAPPLWPENAKSELSDPP